MSKQIYFVRKSKELGGISGGKGHDFQWMTGAILAIPLIYKNDYMYISELVSDGLLFSDDFSVFIGMQMKQTKWNYSNEDLVDDSLSTDELNKMVEAAESLQLTTEFWYVTNRRHANSKKGKFDITTPKAEISSPTYTIDGKSKKILYIPINPSKNETFDFKNQISTLMGVTATKAEKIFEEITALIKAISHHIDEGQTIALSEIQKFAISKKDIVHRIKKEVHSSEIKLDPIIDRELKTLGRKLKSDEKEIAKKINFYKINSIRKEIIRKLLELDNEILSSDFKLVLKKIGDIND